MRIAIDEAKLSMPEQPNDESKQPGDDQSAAEAAVLLSAAYANHIALIGMPHELVLDFFEIMPVAPNGANSRHASRIVLPLSLLKGFADALREQIELYESMGRELPNLRESLDGELS